MALADTYYAGSVLHPDTYYAGSVLHPEKFADINPEEKADEIFEKLLGQKFYDVLKENGYEFRQVQIGE